MMEQKYLIYIFIACIVAAMLFDVGFFLMNKRVELKKIRSMARDFYEY